MLQSLFSSIYEYQQHRCVEVIDAWIADVRVGRFHLAYRPLEIRAHPCYTQTECDACDLVEEPQVIKLLAGFLPRRSSPQVIRKCWHSVKNPSWRFTLSKSTQNQFR
jgi:hypothetical protein